MWGLGITVVTTSLILPFSWSTVWEGPGRVHRLGRAQGLIQYIWLLTLVQEARAAMGWLKISVATQPIYFPLGLSVHEQLQDLVWLSSGVIDFSSRQRYCHFMTWPWTWCLMAPVRGPLKHCCTHLTSLVMLWECFHILPGLIHSSAQQLSPSLLPINVGRVVLNKISSCLGPKWSTLSLHLPLLFILPLELFPSRGHSP